MTEEIKEVQEAPVQEAPAQEAPPELTVNDLNAMKAIIDVACQRGAFKAPEMEEVGKTFNKLSAFLEAAAKQSQPAQGQE
jgi:hypothetical protein